MNNYNIKTLLSNKKEIIHKKVIVKGWVRFFRSNRFIILNDGSCLTNLQIIIKNDSFTKEFLKRITIGSSLKVEGIIINSIGSKQLIELKAEKIKIYSEVSREKLQKTILQPKNHSLEKLREQAHLRFKTNVFSAVMRIRHNLAFAIHKYFHKNDFFYINTPIITSFDSEGIGDTFKVTTLDKSDKIHQDFFGRKTYLTVSGQLEAELAAMGLNKVYTFGPVFRAEKSNTSRHLSEFWMVEPEMAFYKLNDNINLAENLLKFLINYILINCKEDLEFLNNYNSFKEKKTVYNKKNLLELLNYILDNPFIRISYNEVINILNKYNKKNYFINSIYWGMNLQSEHERFIVEKYFQYPTIIFDYPQSVKAFYMRLNNDEKTVAAMDILFPKIGEVIGGSEREDRYDFLLKKMKLFNIKIEDFWWYLDIRIFGSSPHSGFGLGFDRLLQFITGMKNIRDVIPFPRTHNNVEF